MISKFSFAIALVAMSATAALGQPGSHSGGGDDPASQLSANLVILSQNPRDVNALIGAGQSAVAVGDGNAALGFLARAEEIAPRNGRIKAALGSALLLLERPGEALKLFSEASALGIPDSDLAADRGLAHDLRGESRKAQRDYLLAQRIAPSDELTRRLALSYGISGDRANALSMLDPLLRKQDQAAWRARAFILAMTGDLPEAENIASTVMPAGMGNGMRPFLRRLAGLNPADRAMAVNFGTMPGDGTRLASNDYSPPMSAAAGGALIPAGDFSTPRVDDRPVRTAAVAVTRDPRRRPGAADSAGGRPVVTADRSEAVIAPVAAPPAALRPAAPLAVPGRSDRRIEKRLAPVDQDRLPPEIRAALAPPQPAARVPEPAGGSVILAAAVPPKVDRVTPPQSSPVVAAPVFEVPAVMAPSPAQIASATAGTGVTSAPIEVSPPAPSLAQVIPPKPAVEAPQPGLVAVAATPPNPDAGFTVPINQPSVIVGSAPSSPVPASASALAPDVSTAAAPIASVAPAPAQVDPGAAAVASFARPVAVPASVTSAPEGAAAPSPAPTRLADIIATIEPEAESAAAPLPTAAELRAARMAQQKKLAAQAKAEADAKAEKDAKEAAKREASRHPARVWVQVATGANEAGLPTTWKRIRDKSPQLFKGMSAASVPFKSTNRLLVGPVKSQAEARALVNALQKAGMAGTTYSSEAGQEIARIASK
jgi:Flp pilus assembly protein TadD